MSNGIVVDKKARRLLLNRILAFQSDLIHYRRMLNMYKWADDEEMVSATQRLIDDKSAIIKDMQVRYLTGKTLTS